MIAFSPKIWKQFTIQSESMDQGVVPARLKVLRPLCGVRYTTPDNKAWARLRAMLAPSLSPTRFEDLTAFVVAVDDSYEICL